MAGGLNLYGFADGDPVNFSDPFGLCTGKDGNERPCEVRISAYGKEHGASLDDLTPETLARLQEVATAADVDLGINSTANGEHFDPGHAAGTAVDIGYINGKSIGSGANTNPGMAGLAERVQRTAAELGGLKRDIGNLGPTGKFVGRNGPLPFNNPGSALEHKNHVHLSYRP